MRRGTMLAALTVLVVLGTALAPASSEATLIFPWWQWTFPLKITRWYGPIQVVESNEITVNVYNDTYYTLKFVELESVPADGSQKVVREWEMVAPGASVSATVPKGRITVYAEIHDRQYWEYSGDNLTSVHVSGDPLKP